MTFIKSYPSCPYLPLIIISSKIRRERENIFLSREIKRNTDESQRMRDEREKRREREMEISDTDEIERKIKRRESNNTSKKARVLANRPPWREGEEKRVGGEKEYRRKKE